MKGILKYGTLLVSAAILAGCVEFKNGDEEDVPQNPQPMVEVQPMGNLVVDQALYIFEGKIVSEEDLEFQKFKKEKEGETESKSKAEDFEFQFDDLRFEEGGVLYTMGANVRIHAKTLNSANGKIATFPQNKKTILGLAGRSGGHILLNIGKGVGTLIVEMRGETGGDGLPALPPDASLKGPKGPTGAPGVCEQFARFMPKNGGPGGKGLKGYPGKTGGRGGDTGTLDLLVDDSSEFNYVVQKNPGLGGSGSKGGQGGQGGDGGDPGTYIKHADVHCPSAKKGLPGETGDRGDDGIAGASGEKQTSCITKNKAMTCYN